MTTPITDPTGTPPRRVVIAEDEALIRLDLAEMLREEGYQVVGEAGDGQEAVDLAESLRPDLVIMDVNMPGITGIEAATAILAQRPQTTIVLLTANVQAATQAKADAAGVLLFKKPIKGDVIDAILQHLTVPA